MSSIRDKYKATPVDTLKASVAEEDQIVGSRGDNSYHDIEDGSNTFRIYPKKEDDRTYSHIRVQHWITVEDDDGGDPKRRSVYNARQHGGQQKDVIEQYIKHAPEHIRNTTDDPAEQAEKIKTLTAFNGGLGASVDWIVWADKVKKVDGELISTLRLLSLKKTIRDDMNAEATMADETDEAITVDPYTDPDTGRRITVDKSKTKKGKREQTVYKTKIGKELPLTDEQLEAFDEKPSLTELFGNIYTKEMFDLAVEGLKYFDEANEIGLFDGDEWLDEVAQLKKALIASKGKSGGADVKEDAKGKVAVKSGSKVVKKAAKPEPEPEIEEEPEPEEEPTEEGDEFDEMDRDGLKTYIVKNGLKEQVKVFKSDTDDDIREKIRAVVSTEEEPEPEPEEAPAKPATKTSLDDIKKRIMSGKSKK